MPPNNSEDTAICELLIWGKNMTTYAVGYLTDVHMGPEIVSYLERIDATLSPFGGYFVIHGGSKEQLEGQLRGDLVVISFPDSDAARAWYRSEAYQAIISLRTENSQSTVFLIEGVDRQHRATDVLSQV